MPTLNFESVYNIKKQPIIHPKFGDLSRLDSVILPRSLNKAPYAEKKFSCFHLTVTSKCNAMCNGCINNSITTDNDFNFPDTVPERDSNAILQLITNLPNDETPVVCFYGGEPLLELKKIQKVIGYIEKARKNGEVKYMLLTNGMNLDYAINQYPDIINKIYLFSISIDGQEKQHNNYRKGTDLYKIVKNIKILKKVKNNLTLMWATLRESQSLLDIYEEFNQLYKLGLIDLFYWHFEEKKEYFNNLENFLNRYESDLVRIMDNYIESLENKIILPIIHINELILYFLYENMRNSTGCGIETRKHVDIINSKIIACADLPLEFAHGKINDNGNLIIHRENLSFITDYKDKLNCYKCGIHNYCGGRCPVHGFTAAAYRLIENCQLMRLHVGIVGKYIGRIIDILHKKKIDPSLLYKRSAMFTRLTCVVP